MNMEDLFSFLPMLVFILMIVLDKSSRGKRKKQRGHFPPLPDIKIPRRDEEDSLPDVSRTEQKNNGRVYEDKTAAKKEKTVPWYVEFPEDKKEKQQGRVYQEPKKEPQKVFTAYPKPAFAVPSMQAAPKRTFAMPAAKPKKPAFNGKLNRQRVRDGFIMAQILDKPRALKPYTDPY